MGYIIVEPVGVFQLLLSRCHVIPADAGNSILSNFCSAGLANISNDVQLHIITLSNDTL